MTKKKHIKEQRRLQAEESAQNSHHRRRNIGLAVAGAVIIGLAAAYYAFRPSSTEVETISTDATTVQTNQRSTILQKSTINEVVLTDNILTGGEYNPGFEKVARETLDKEIRLELEKKGWRGEPKWEYRFQKKTSTYKSDSKDVELLESSRPLIEKYLTYLNKEWNTTYTLDIAHTLTKDDLAAKTKTMQLKMIPISSVKRINIYRIDIIPTRGAYQIDANKQDSVPLFATVGVPENFGDIYRPYDIVSRNTRPVSSKSRYPIIINFRGVADTVILNYMKQVTPLIEITHQLFAEITLNNINQQCQAIQNTSLELRLKKIRNIIEEENNLEEYTVHAIALNWYFERFPDTDRQFTEKQANPNIKNISYFRKMIDFVKENGISRSTEIYRKNPEVIREILDIK